MKHSDYIRISKTVIRKLRYKGCWGNGSMYDINLKGKAKEDKKQFDKVLNVLCKQGILCCKPHKFGKKYYLNKEKRQQIKQIIGEKPRKDKPPMLLFLLADSPCTTHNPDEAPSDFTHQNRYIPQ